MSETNDAVRLQELRAAAIPGPVYVEHGMLLPFCIPVGLGAMRVEDAEFIAAMYNADLGAWELDGAIGRLKALMSSLSEEEVDEGLRRFDGVFRELLAEWRGGRR